VAKYNALDEDKTYLQLQGAWPQSKKKCGRDLWPFRVTDFDSITMVTGVDEHDVLFNQALGLYGSPVLVVGQP